MEALQATPETLEKIFDRCYCIPEYQRPYSWEKEQCEKLWEDLRDFADSSPGKQDQYFLGNIVLYEEDGQYCVVDGQQRLISLTLLMRAIFDKVQTYNSLERCLYIFDDESGKNTSAIKIQSKVMSEEKEQLKKILVDRKDDDSLYTKNYSYFKDVLDSWVTSMGADNTPLKNFIRVLLKNVVLLPIKCGALDDALTIFETINNRGLSLSDADIFKARLHKNAGDAHADFIAHWNALTHGVDELFKLYMHILRAQEGITERERALRLFFLDKDAARLSDWKRVIKDIERLDACMTFLENNGPTDSAPRQNLQKWFQTLTCYPNQYWQYPIHTYLFRHIDEEGNLSEKDMAALEELMRAIIAYCYTKAVIYNSVNVIRDTIFRVCVSIWREEPFLPILSSSLEKDLPQLERALSSSNYPRSLRGLCFLHAYLNPEQELIRCNPHIEHILPRKWNNYDGWTTRSHQKDVDKLGNLVLLEKQLNISARNEFFQRKQESYRCSEIKEARNLSACEDWTPQILQARQLRIQRELHAFFASLGQLPLQQGTPTKHPRISRLQASPRSFSGGRGNEGKRSRTRSRTSS